MGNRAVIMVDKRAGMVGSIHLPTDVMEERVSCVSGEIIAVGNGEKIKHMDLTPGVRIVFRGYIKFAYPLPTEERWEDGTLKEFFLANVDDLALVISKDTDITIHAVR